MSESSASSFSLSESPAFLLCGMESDRGRGGREGGGRGEEGGREGEGREEEEGGGGRRKKERGREEEGGRREKMEEKGGEIKNLMFSTAVIGQSHWKLPMQAHRQLADKLTDLLC